MGLYVGTLNPIVPEAAGEQLYVADSLVCRWALHRAWSFQGLGYL